MCSKFAAFVDVCGAAMIPEEEADGRPIHTSDSWLSFLGCRALAAGEAAGLDPASLQLCRRTVTAVRDFGMWPSRTLSA